MVFRKSSKKSLNAAKSGSADFDLHVPQVIKRKIGVILWPLAVALFIVAGWVVWTVYVRHSNVQALAMYEKTVRQSQDQVTPALERLVKEYPDTKAGQLARIELGHAYYREGKVDLAIRNYEDSLERMPEDHGLRPVILLSLGYCFEMKGDYSAALRYFNAAMESGADRLKIVASVSLGRVYRKIKDPDKAVNAYKRALSINDMPGPYKSIAEWEMAQVTARKGAPDK